MIMLALVLPLHVTVARQSTAAFDMVHCASSQLSIVLSIRQQKPTRVNVQRSIHHGDGGGGGAVFGVQTNTRSLTAAQHDTWFLVQVKYTQPENTTCFHSFRDRSRFSC